MHDSSLTICSLHSAPQPPRPQPASQPASQPTSAQQQPEHSSHIWPPTPSQLLALVITHKPRVLLLSPPSLMISPLLGLKPEKHGAHRCHLESRAERGVSLSGWSFLLRWLFVPAQMCVAVWRYNDDLLGASALQRWKQNQPKPVLTFTLSVPTLRGKHRILVVSQVIVSKRKDFPTFG